jgi:hypothetical protein
VKKIEDLEEKTLIKEKELDLKIRNFEDKEIKKLEELSSLSEEEAKNKLIEIVENRVK